VRRADNSTPICELIVIYFGIDLYSWASIRIIKMMRWAGHVA
jgi:hypothetical protein